MRATHVLEKTYLVRSKINFFTGDIHAACYVPVTIRHLNRVPLFKLKPATLSPESNIGFFARRPRGAYCASSGTCSPKSHNCSSRFCWVCGGSQAVRYMR